MHLPGGWPNIGKTSNKIPKFKDLGADFKYHSFFFQTDATLRYTKKRKMDHPITLIQQRLSKIKVWNITV